MASLARRLEIARATHNSQLVQLLEQEKQQFTTSVPLPKDQPRLNWLKAFRQNIAKMMARHSELQVCQFVNGSDRWWYAIDPQTGDCVYADSEAELRLWIQQNYRGQ